MTVAVESNGYGNILRLNRYTGSSVANLRSILLRKQISGFVFALIMKFLTNAMPGKVIESEDPDLVE